jgi:uncharacterized membrane protein HdeD (DUF308 family)
MSGKQIGGIVCFFLAALFMVTGVNTIVKNQGLADPSGLGVSRAMGTMLPGLVTLIVGVWLFQKPKQE